MLSQFDFIKFLGNVIVFTVVWVLMIIVWKKDTEQFYYYFLLSNAFLFCKQFIQCAPVNVNNYELTGYVVSCFIISCLYYIYWDIHFFFCGIILCYGCAVAQ